jgi:hypothetical protein
MTSLLKSASILPTLNATEPFLGLGDRIVGHPLSNDADVGFDVPPRCGRRPGKVGQRERSHRRRYGQVECGAAHHISPPAEAGVKGGEIVTRQRVLRADRLRGGVSRSAIVAIALGTSR